ncbi:hypothetical protein J4405_03190 [Candidatus Woesearchaeota archaeon]|nr:hypothetical protein [Candidatus Woesearchaeota archaeon]
MILLRPTNTEIVYQRLRSSRRETEYDCDIEELMPGDIEGITCDTPTIPLPAPLEKCYVLLESDGFAYSGEIGISAGDKTCIDELRGFNRVNLIKYFEDLRSSTPVDLGDKIIAMDSGVYFYDVNPNQASFMLCYDIEDNVALLTFGKSGTRRRELSTPGDFKKSLDDFCRTVNLVINCFYANPYEHKLELPVYF